MLSLMKTPPERPSQAVSRALSLALSSGGKPQPQQQPALLQTNNRSAAEETPAWAARSPSDRGLASYREVLVDGSATGQQRGDDLLLDPDTPRGGHRPSADRAAASAQMSSKNKSGAPAVEAMRSALLTRAGAGPLAQASPPKELPRGYHSGQGPCGGQASRFGKGPEVVAKWVQDVKAKQANGQQHAAGTRRRWPQAKLDMEVAPSQSGASGDPGHAVVMDKLLSQMADKLIEQQRTPSRYRAPSYGQGPVAHQLDRSSDSSTDSFWESQEAKALVDQVKWLEQLLAQEKQATAALRAEKSTTSALLEAAALQVELAQEASLALRAAKIRSPAPEAPAAADPLAVPAQVGAQLAERTSLDVAGGICWEEPAVGAEMADEEGGTEEEEDAQQEYEEESWEAEASEDESAEASPARPGGHMWRSNPLADDSGSGGSGVGGSDSSMEGAREAEQLARGGAGLCTPPCLERSTGALPTPMIGVRAVSARRITRLQHPESFRGVENLLFEGELPDAEAAHAGAPQAGNEEAGGAKGAVEAGLIARLGSAVGCMEGWGSGCVSLLVEGRQQVDKLEAALDLAMQQIERSDARAAEAEVRADRVEGECRGMERRLAEAEARAAAAAMSLGMAQKNDALAATEAQRVVRHLNCVETEVRFLRDTLDPQKLQPWTPPAQDASPVAAAPALPSLSPQRTATLLGACPAELRWSQKRLSEGHESDQSAGSQGAREPHESMQQVSRWAGSAFRTLSQERALLVADLSALRAETSSSSQRQTLQNET
eukprot:jgi/Tetstr1/447755/TSEL_035088.t1